MNRRLRRRPAGVRIAASAIIERNGQLDLGQSVHIDHGALVDPHRGYITIGKRSYVGPYALLYGHGGLTIGERVLIAGHAVIIPSNHVTDDVTRPIMDQGNRSLGITIEDNVWIGAHVTVLDGSVIGRDSVVAAGAVVRGRIPPFSLVAGVPGRVLRQRA